MGEGERGQTDLPTKDGTGLPSSQKHMPGTTHLREAWPNRTDGKLATDLQVDRPWPGRTTPSNQKRPVVQNHPFDPHLKYGGVLAPQMSLIKALHS